MLEVSPCDSSVFAFSHLVHAPSFLWPTAVAKRLTSTRWWISSDTIFLLFAVDSLDHQRCGCRPRSAFPFTTVPIISFILRADSAFSTAISAFHFRPVITKGWTFSPVGHESHAAFGRVSLFLIYIPQQLTTLEVLVLWINYIVPRLLRSWVLQIIFFINVLFNCSIVSTFVSDTSYICNGLANLGINPK